MAEDTALVVGEVAISAADSLGLLMIRLNPSVRALVTPSVSAMRMAGHQVWMVCASRVLSGIAASIAAS